MLRLGAKKGAEGQARSSYVVFGFQIDLCAHEHVETTDESDEHR